MNKKQEASIIMTLFFILYLFGCSSKFTDGLSYIFRELLVYSGE